MDELADSKFETKAHGPYNFETHIFLTVNPNPHYPYSWTGRKISLRTRHVFEIACFFKTTEKENRKTNRQVRINGQMSTSNKRRNKRRNETYRLGTWNVQGGLTQSAAIEVLGKDLNARRIISFFLFSWMISREFLYDQPHFR